MLWVVIAAFLTGCGGRSLGGADDEAIGRAIKRALYDHEPANLLHVEADVEEGIVYLDGEVDEYEHKKEAERIAREVEGVKDVVNKLQVQP